MPRIPVIETQTLPNAVQQARVEGGFVDAQPLARGVGAAALALGNEQIDIGRSNLAAAVKQARIARAEAKQQEADEAALYITNSVTQGRATFAERVRNAQNDPELNPVGFSKATLAEFDAWSQGQVDAAPKLAKRQMQQRMLELRLHVEDSAVTFENAARKANLLNDFNTGLDADQRAVWADPSLAADTIASRLAAARTLGVDPQTRAKLESQTRDGIATSAAMGLVEKDYRTALAIMRDPKRMKADPIFANVPPERLQVALHRAQTLENQARALAEARATAAAAQGREHVRDVIGMLNDGFAPSSQVLQQAQVYAKGSPLAEKLSEAMRDSQVAQQFRALSPVEQRTALNDARAQIGTPDGARVYKRLESIAADTERRLSDDAFTYGVQSLGFRPTPFDISNPAESLVVRSKQAAVLQSRFGVPVSPLTPQEAAQLSETLRPLPPEQKATKLAEIGSAVGDRRMLGALAQQIDKGDKMLATALMYGAAKTPEGEFVSKLILRGQQAQRDGAVKIDQAKETGWRATVSREIGNAYPDPELRSRMIDSAMTIATALAADSGSVDLERAVTLATGGIRTQGDDSKIPLPYGMKERDFAKALKGYPADRLPEQMFASGVPLSREQFKAGLPDALLVHAGQGRYAVRSGGGLITGADGKPVVVELGR